MGLVGRQAGALKLDEEELLSLRSVTVLRQGDKNTWLEIVLDEGRNRQVRRMTAAAGFPTLRLIRHAIGPWTIEGLATGQWHEIPSESAKSSIKNNS